MYSSGSDQRAPDHLLGLGRAEIDQGSGEPGARQSAAFILVRGIEHGGLVHHDSVRSPATDSAWPQNDHLRLGGRKAVETEQSRRCTVAHARVCGTRGGHYRQPLFPCRWISADDKHPPCRLSDPAALFGDADVAGCVNPKETAWLRRTTPWREAANSAGTTHFAAWPALHPGPRRAHRPAGR
jgi:hypothetical protein